jgi:hypothetical protein
MEGARAQDYQLCGIFTLEYSYTRYGIKTTYSMDHIPLDKANILYTSY